MIPLLKSSRIHFVLATGICSLFLGGGVALSQEAQPPEKARALLDQVKKSEQDREIAGKQTEIDRIKEDQARIERDSAALNKTIESTTGLTTDANNELVTLTGESRRLEHDLAVAEARMKAEKLKIEGLRALSEAQSKSLSALGFRAEEAFARSSLKAIELEMMQAGKQVPAEGREGDSHTQLIKARKTLAAAEAKTESEERLAHDAMKAATAKMTLAETSAATAQRLADNDLTLEAPAAKPVAKAKPVEKPAAEKPAPVAAGPAKPAASNTETPSKPATKTTTTTPAKTTSKSRPSFFR